MKPEYKLYFNNHFFDLLYDQSVYGDRPESYRMHEKTLWTVYQILRSRIHTLTIVSESHNSTITMKTENEFKDWVKDVYQNLYDQLDKPISTKYPHPGDQLKM